MPCISFSPGNILFFSSLNEREFCFAAVVVRMNVLWFKYACTIFYQNHSPLPSKSNCSPLTDTSQVKNI